MTERMELVSIGVIRSPYKTPADAPRQGRLSGALSKIEIEEEYMAGVGDLEVSRHIIVLYWLDRANRDTLSATPPGTSRKRPVFQTRSPHRPNPIGLAVARVEKREGNTLTVTGLDALDGTPVLDIKPYSPGIDSIPDAKEEFLLSDRPEPRY
ncbi:MAG: tRNA (N6-threonylcarbamoyladenosine(37)-N6)-methyltransferase TrmO [Methanoregulaceae archaeon]|nr:tRNA (N6-threonylcarbamoyladenosine(37)-N6)-methyltransferase TrmO [Methanoregulaceae archaeon]MDD3091223.1 tRNA (N6-threonylcarbamoyladenosine(37)-N6)-methyltransferase TrmO [Methanoregulaceae archaeon]MDD5048255.1 tRNA (N6-threonylcarbamoyladenosine(37)-N6)-methyltransferase TrmO [Methanoregulaceae archaeon]MDD5685126.1 tRNA (N6-threonylcarbamoyladenosine(37)-N6)-methyltransferase TrmO [Methanoregulaceae archaeon]HOP67314.1 tRNA (N6-threonylcarbamoyladenosine(37)-N6)-methyltransferase TrmO